MATIHQVAALCVNERTSFPVEEFVKPCVAAGYGRVDILLNPNHPSTEPVIPKSYVDGVKATGAKCWGRVWADSFTSAEALYAFVLQERQRLGVTGFGINAEDGWEAKDQTTLGQWSKTFLNLFRSNPLTAKLGLYIDTYNGCGGIALPFWMKAGARLVCQTHHEGQTHEWPIDGYMDWAKFYGWTKPSMVKAELGTYKPLPNRGEQIAAMKRAQAKGYGKGLLCYYSEGAGDPAEHLIPLLNEAKAAGVTY